MPIYLKQSTASQEIPLGVFVDETDGFTAETALTIANTDIKLWKTGATTLANKNTGGATHISGGIYYAVLDGTDTDTLGPMVVFVHVSGARPVRVETVVLAANVYDSLIAASDQLQVDAIQISGDATAADNAELMFDGTGYAGGTTKLGVDVVSISGDTTAADNLEESATGIVTGAAAAGTLSTTQMTTNLTEATDDHYNGRIIIWTSGALAGQATDITDYTGSTKLLTYTAVTEAPSAADTFVIV